VPGEPFNPSFSSVIVLMGCDRAVNMLATLKMIREKYGGPEQYVIDRCGLTEDDVHQIRSNLVVKAPAIQIL
jgi:hypothetical protein